MKKVYVLIDEGCYDCESGVDVRVHSDIEKARKDFEESRAQLIAYWVDDGSWVIEDDDEDYFSIGEDGYYAHAHASLKLVEKDILY